MRTSDALDRHGPVLLAAAGALPFWIVLAAGLGAAEPHAHVAVTYGAAMIALLAGLRAGFAMKGSGAHERRRSLVPAGLLAGAATVASQAPAAVGLGLAISCFLVQALWDVTSVESRQLPADVAKARLVFIALSVVPLIGVLGSVVFGRP
ncbi:MAG TPA: DUF3429 family protein [Aestuariivirgaceae bacterium]|nr:DUF3429 family protein [Aestuariivirgaceae bacterium]